MRIRFAVPLMLLALTACTSAYEHAPLSTPSACQACARPPPPPPPPKKPTTAPAALSDAAKKVQVLTEAEAPKPCEVVGVLDFHTDEDSEDKGFDELRARAAELGADAVIAADFEHGAEGEKSHLSGVAVKYKPVDGRPFKVLARIDIPTPEDADDKGFETMRSKAASLGADEVIAVKFHHGAEGEMSHLTGLAIRFTVN